ncbi:o-methyltransferase domain protein [Colletotrichum truncatum]|uniref:O-methyltransferase domain protein n=1 Tax=Colletotrichum truncatum TaxID=5467 RepID=A0ACC3YGW0_COLTU|nr:o-methyltransferase domain protein [Colletotrichum truncatum]KAF6784109.1 o-methyltransferase domain protein [Colletotrichum truncatum]
MASATTTTALSKGKVKLSGAQETLLLTLFARAKDAESSNPILNDQHALEIVSQIRDQGYDFNRTFMGPKDLFAGPVAMRARMLDVCTERFLRRNPGPATILHLACGMDSRCHRVKWQGEGRIWIDADKEDVVELRRQVMNDPDPGKGGEYRLIHPNIHSDTWLREAKIPTDRPVLVLFEGLTPYLTKDELNGLVRRIVNYFRSHGAHGELRFDAIGSITYYTVNYVFRTPFKTMGTRFYSYLDNPRSLAQEVPGLRFKDQIFLMSDLFRYGFMGMILGFFGWLIDLFHISARIAGGYGYEF